MSDDKKTIKFQMMMSPSEAEALDDWGFSHRIRSRAEAIRQLIQKGLLYEVTDKYSDIANKMIRIFLRGETPPPEMILDYIEQGEMLLDATHANGELIRKTTIEFMAHALVQESGLPYDEALKAAQSRIGPAPTSSDSDARAKVREERLAYVANLREEFKKLTD